MAANRLKTNSKIKMAAAQINNFQRNTSNQLHARIFDSAIVAVEIFLFFIKAIYIIAESVYRLFSPIAEKSVKNEIVLITGAGRGIGKELALQYASHGATVVCWGISKDKNLTTVDEIARLGYTKAYFYECDVSNQQAVKETAEKVLKEVGDVSILINNAGVGHPKTLLEQTYSEIESCININLVSHFWTIQAFLPTMIKNNHGHIVANCSVGGLVGLKNGLPYCASKFAVRGMMEALFQELRKNSQCKIKLTTVYPYLVKTEIFKQATMRFPQLMPILDAPYVAQQIISAQKRNVHELSIPGYFTYLVNICRLFPVTMCAMVYDFLDIQIDQ